MPLARYEIRNEYSLANPDLYRSAAKDDPEGLLEGVAMAGLVGIIRQLGDLAEFAAEVFHDLHEEVLATAARGHELLIRVQQLEAELPVVEKLILAESSQFNYAYAQGVEWHASIRDDQNHLTQGDLPRFIRNAYEDCRGPPRLFLLDKFDVAGAGACLKRYTDPYFFKMEWASSELLKAEKEQQDKRARRIKKKGRQHQNVEFKEASLPSQMPLRTQHHTSLDVENQASSSSVQHANSNLEVGSKNASFGPALDKAWDNEPLQAPLSKVVPQDEVYNHNASMDAYVQDGNLTSSANSYKPLKEDSKEMGAEDMSVKFSKENHEDVVVQKEYSELGPKIGEDVGDDVTSETEHYMDALATMDSEVETDSESKTKLEADSEFNSELKAAQVSGRFNYPPDDELNILDEQVVDTEDDIIFTHAAAENSEPFKEEKEPIPSIANSPKAEILFVEQDESPPVVHNIFPSMQEIPLDERSVSPFPTKYDALSRSDDHLDSGSIDHVSETPQSSEVNDHDNTQVESFGESFHLLQEPAILSTNGDRPGFSEAVDPLLLHKQVQSSHLLSKEDTQSLPEGDASEASKSESAESPKEFPRHAPAEPTSQRKRWTVDFSHLQIATDTDDDIDEMQMSSTLSSPKQVDLLNGGATRSMPEGNNSELSKSESNDSPRELFPHSPADPALHPMKWKSTFSQPHMESLDTDDDMDGMQISSSSPSSSSSMLSSPRPSMLATTVFHMGSDDEPNSVVSTQESSPSSQKSPICDTPHPPVAPHSPMSLPRTAPDFLPLSTMYNENIHSTYFDASTSTQSSSVFVAEPEQSPPLPPLPPLEWWMIKHFHKSPSTLKHMESPPTPPVPPIAIVEPETNSDVFKPSAVLSKDEWSDSPITTVPYNALEGSSPTLMPPKVEREIFPSHARSGNITPERNDNKEQNISFSPHARTNESLLDSSNVTLASENGRKNALMTSQRPGKAIQDSQMAMPPLFERKDSLIKAIASHDRNTMRKVSEQVDSIRPVPSDDRVVLLEQIRTRSFSLRHTQVEKHEAPRPVTNINVAAILEKANAIRQAFAGSDEDDEDDDDWSDM